MISWALDSHSNLQYLTVLTKRKRVGENIAYMTLRELNPQVPLTEKGSEKCLSSLQVHWQTSVTHRQ